MKLNLNQPLDNLELADTQTDTDNDQVAHFRLPRFNRYKFKNGGKPRDKNKPESNRNTGVEP